MPAAVQLGTKFLYTELSEGMLFDLMEDILWRYESLFMLEEPQYQVGKSELLFHVLKDGYALAPCANPVGIEVINLDHTMLTAVASTTHDWKEEGAGRLIAKAFASTINA